MKAVSRLSLVLTILIIVVSPTRAQRGKIVFEDTTYTFEKMREGEMGRHVFSFRNEGTSALRITGVRSSCGCTIPDWVQDQIPPGGTGSVAIVYNSAGRPGPFYKSVIVESDGEPRSVTLTVAGDVEARWLEEGIQIGNVIVDRDSVNLGLVSRGQDIRYTFQMQNTGRRPIRITALDTDGDNIHVLFPSMPIFRDDVVNITVIISTDDLRTDNSFEYTVQLTTDDGTQSVKSFHVKGRIGTSRM